MSNLTTQLIVTDAQLDALVEVLTTLGADEYARQELASAVNAEEMYWGGELTWTDRANGYALYIAKRHFEDTARTALVRPLRDNPTATGEAFEAANARLATIFAK